MTFLATLLGFTLARIADPLLLIIAFIFGMKMESRFHIALLAIVYAVLATVIFSTSNPGSRFITMMIAGLLASFFWFSLFYSLANYRRNRKNSEVDETFE
jgi:hypothetical protein